MTLPIDNKVIIFLYRRSRTFFTANGGLFVFAAIQPAIRQARMGVAGNIREHAHEILSDTHRRKGQSPEKPQIFLYLFVVVYSRIKENTLQVTPTAKRNSYRVAILVGRLPRVASFARNPGLGKRNSFRVAAAYGGLLGSPARLSTRDGSSFLLCLRMFSEPFSPWRRSGWAPMVDGAHPWQLWRSCDYTAQG